MRLVLTPVAVPGHVPLQHAHVCLPQPVWGRAVLLALQQLHHQVAPLGSQSQCGTDLAEELNSLVLCNFTMRPSFMNAYAEEEKRSQNSK